ncbi:integrase [Bacillus cereus]|uniref:Integrase n=1 Tax=Bacillus thuringiensis TaxID=1428 RepID=A0A9X6YIU5_BACTU|nr:integrase [Bacillus thuringiensis]PEA93010.1 integrase [Bacillus cereus]PEC74958.1 integrase [Bacillus thuringiensis]PED16540.1 integrase [Bacillus thuringiensis]PED34243.1 integrase [Bacillus cereus]
MNQGISLEVAFSAYLAENGHKQSRVERYNYDIKGFYK